MKRLIILITIISLITPYPLQAKNGNKGQGELQFNEATPEYLVPPGRQIMTNEQLDRYLQQQQDKRRMGTYNYKGKREDKGTIPQAPTLKSKTREVLDQPGMSVQGINTAGLALLGKMAWPLKDPNKTKLNSDYGERILDGKPDFHYGLDLKDDNRVIYAAAPGKVVSADGQNVSGWKPMHWSYGRAVKILHDGNIRTIYAHMSKVLVKAGDEVKSGDVLGIMGTTGNSSGIHLHFEVNTPKNQGSRAKYSSDAKLWLEYYNKK